MTTYAVEIAEKSAAWATCVQDLFGLTDLTYEYWANKSDIEIIGR